MADPIGGAIVSGLVEAILDKLGKPAFQEIVRIIGVKDELKRLNNTLSAIDAVLLDAEEQQSTLHSVRSWLGTLKDVAYDIEDVLDLISTQDLKRKASGRSLSRKVSALSLRYKFARKIKAICGRLDEIATNRRNYNFREHQQPSLPSLETSSRERESYSFVQESHVFGREDDTEWIVARLVSSSSQELKEIPVLPIVGIGGMGKTTLAKLVFNDPRIREIENFELKLWAYVPNKFDLKTVMCNIIQSATGETSSGLNIEAIKNRLHQIIYARAFLLVLDNVWIEDSKGWFELKELLDVGSKASKIIVTAREDRVASIAGTMEEYKLKPLSHDHCWSIFVTSAFRQGEEEAYPSLVQIGKSIVQKCCGVPLAAKTMGSQLRSVRDFSTWRMIKESELWKINQPAPDDILPALKLSFNQLPYHLRSCFSFCSTTLKGDHINREWMILDWMALGLLESKEMNGTLEDVGNAHFEELRSRSFFQVVNFFAYAVRHLAMYNNMSEAYVGVSLRKMTDRAFTSDQTYGTVKHVQMHDLMHDLATYVTGEEAFVLNCGRHDDVSARVRFIVWKAEKDLLERDQFPNQLLTAKKARSLEFRSKRITCMSKFFLGILFSSFRCLRILSLAGFVFQDLPSSVGDLKHLRLLNLSHNYKLKGLPDSVCALVNLQTLNVFRCLQLERFPRDMHRLISLRYLLFTSKLVTFPESSLGGWTFMQQISICDCKNLAFLPKQIAILTTLGFLEINRCPNLVSLPDSIDQLTSLQVLRIFDCEKLDLTGWEGLHGLRSLIQLNIQQLPLLVHFPDGLQTVSGSLKYLIVKLCRNLIDLPKCLEQCTSLLKLTLYKCPSLSTLPSGIQGVKSLQELWIFGCPELNPRCQRERGECWHLISHIPMIQVDNCCIQKEGFHTL